MPFQHDYADSTQVVLLGMESATDKEVWQKARDEGFVIVTRDADLELSLDISPRK
jgi:predicted nuclease of predicted toxin-antitoxin system